MEIDKRKTHLRAQNKLRLHCRESETAEIAKRRKRPNVQYTEHSSCSTFRITLKHDNPGAKKKEKCRTLKTRLPPNPTSPSSIFACNRIQAAPYLLRFSRRVNVKEAQRRIAEILISPTFRAKKELAYSSLAARPLSSLSISLSSSSTERPPREKENEPRVASLAGSFFLVDSD